jgi:hypothetical protein
MIVILKLTNSQEVAGELMDSSVDGVTLNRPLLINYRYYITGTPSVSFARYAMFSATEQMSFQRCHIVNEIEARASFDAVYERQADYFFTEHEKSIDAELDSFNDRNNDEQDTDQLKTLLEMMPVDGVQVN